MKLSLSKRQGRFLKEVIEHWSNEQTIDEPTRKRLEESLEIRSFEWKSLAIYSFWISIICLTIAFGAIFADNFLLKLLEKIFTISNVTLALFFAAASVGFYLWAYRRSITSSRVITTEFVLVLGVLSTAASIAYIGRAVGMWNDHFALLILAASVVYGAVGVLFPSKLVFIVALLSFGYWFGAETGYLSNWGTLFWGMNYPLRFAILGAMVTGASFLFYKSRRMVPLQSSTYTFGLLILLAALWLLSIFGNHGDLVEWSKVRQVTLLGWGVLSGMVSLAVTLYGLKYDDIISKGFGITFLLINLYTKYFEFFWDRMHKAIFFLVLALTFWIIGKNAERIWSLNFKNRKEIDYDE